MPERLSTLILVTLISVVVWLYAEAETRDEAEAPARVSLVGGETGWFVRTVEGTSVRVTVDLQGSRAALQRARNLLGLGALSFSPGDPGLPARGGDQTVNVLELLQSHEGLRGTGVTVVSARPLTLQAEIEAIESRVLAVDADLAGTVETEGEVEVEPSEVTVEARSGLLAMLDESASARVRLPADAVEQLELGQVNEVEGSIVLPEALRGATSVTVSDRRALVRFTPAGRVETATMNPAVWFRLPQNEAGRWRVELDGGPTRPVTLEGPRELVERYQVGGADTVILQLTLSSADLAAGEGRKTVVATSLSGTPLPSELSVSIGDAEVTWRGTSVTEVGE